MPVPDSYNRKQFFAGMLMGVLIPLGLVLLMVKGYFPDRPVTDFFSSAMENETKSKILSLSMIGNGILFFLLIRKDRLLMCRGLLVATLLIGVGIVYLKFF